MFKRREKDIKGERFTHRYYTQLGHSLKEKEGNKDRTKKEKDTEISREIVGADWHGATHKEKRQRTLSMVEGMIPSQRGGGGGGRDNRWIERVSRERDDDFKSDQRTVCHHHSHCFPCWAPECHCIRKNHSLTWAEAKTWNDVHVCHTHICMSSMCNSENETNHTISNSVIQTTPSLPSIYSSLCQNWKRTTYCWDANLHKNLIEETRKQWSLFQNHVHCLGSVGTLVPRFVLWLLISMALLLNETGMCQTAWCYLLPYWETMIALHSPFITSFNWHCGGLSQ